MMSQHLDEEAIFKFARKIVSAADRLTVPMAAVVNEPSRSSTAPLVRLIVPELLQLSCRLSVPPS